MHKKKKINIVTTKDAMTCCISSRNNAVRSLNFFAFKLHSWFVFVEDLGEDVEKKNEQLALF
ncbi:hypothetical protein ABVS17_001189 [Vibrio parahaemolyticus]